MGGAPPVTEPPPPPTGLAAESATARSIVATWTPPALEDGDEVADYVLYADGTKAGETASTRFEFTGVTCGRAHELGVAARDGSRRTSERVTVTASTAACPSDGPVAAYAFDEGTGMTVEDSSGHGRTGTFSAAIWPSGRWGTRAAGFFSSSYITLPPLGTFYDDAFTLEAWVYTPAGLTGDKAIVGTWNNGTEGGPMLWVDNKSVTYKLTLNRGSANYLDSAVRPVGSTWQHLAATYDGATARIYVDGVEVGSKTFAGNVGDSNVWRIGAYGATPVGFFRGSIEDVRIYDRALSAGEIRSDMETPVRH